VLVVRLCLICLLLLPGAPANAEWAVAFGRDNDGGWSSGYSWNQNNRDAAKNMALRNCFAKATAGQHCLIVLDGANGCVALATSESNAWGVAREGSDSSARAAAIMRCQSPGTSCYVRDAFCDTTAGFRPPQGSTAHPSVPRTPPQRSDYPPCSNWPYWNDCTSRCSDQSCRNRCQQNLENDVGQCRAN
jgi:hypothetical protein